MSKDRLVPDYILGAFSRLIPIADPDRIGKKDSGVPCRATCKGTIIEERSRRYFGDPMHAIIGPGSLEQMTLVVEYYCSHCGIMYHHLPEDPHTDKK